MSYTQFILLQVSHVFYTSLIVLLTLANITSVRSAKSIVVKKEVSTIQICTFYVRKPQYIDLDEKKFPVFILLVSILETLCFAPSMHLLLCYVLQGNVRFLLAKEDNYLTKFYDPVTFAEGIQRWPNFSWYSLQRIACNFFIEAGLVYHKGDGPRVLARENKLPMTEFCSLLRGASH